MKSLWKIMAVPVFMPLSFTVTPTINALFLATELGTAVKSDQTWSICTDVGKEMLSLSSYYLPKLSSPPQWYTSYLDILFLYCFQGFQWYCPSLSDSFSHLIYTVDWQIYSHFEVTFKKLCNTVMIFSMPTSENSHKL